MFLLPVAVMDIPNDAQDRIVGHGLDRPDELGKELGTGKNSGTQVGRYFAGLSEHNVGILPELVGELDEGLLSGRSNFAAFDA